MPDLGLLCLQKRQRVSLWSKGLKYICLIKCHILENLKSPVPMLLVPGLYFDFDFIFN